MLDGPRSKKETEKKLKENGIVTLIVLGTKFSVRASVMKHHIKEVT